MHILDFFHATEYLADVSTVLKKTEKDRKEWLESACHDLKHKTRGAQFILRELKSFKQALGGSVPEILSKTITYFENNLHRMKYAQYQKEGKSARSSTRKLEQQTAKIARVFNTY